MLAKILPGVAIPVLLGALFCCAPEIVVERPRAPVANAREKRYGEPSAPLAFPALRRGNDRVSPNTGQREPVASIIVPGVPLEAVSSESADRPIAIPEPLAPESRWPIPLSSLTFPGIRSSGALANLAPRPAATGMPVCPQPAAHPSCTQPPAKGVNVWARVSGFEEKQKEYEAGYSRYTHDGEIFNVGFVKDWTIDSSVGLEAEFIDSELKSGHEADSRRSDINAYMFTAKYLGTWQQKYPFELNLHYGRADVKGRGEFGELFVHSWPEDKHSSSVYGASGKVAFPLVFGDDVKLVPEVGLRYLHLSGESQDLDFGTGPLAFRVPKASARSLTMPTMISLKKEYEYSWGGVMPRLKVGMIYEFSDSAATVRTFNAGASGVVTADPATGLPHSLERDKAQKTYFEFGVGFDLLSRGGWDLRADYARVWGKKYSNDRFTLELGKWF